jgi:hypothetical protein
MAGGCLALGVALPQIVQRRYRGVPPKHVVVRDRHGNEKPRPGRVGLG